MLCPQIQEEFERSRRQHKDEVPSSPLTPPSRLEQASEQPSSSMEEETI